MRSTHLHDVTTLFRGGDGGAGGGGIPLNCHCLIHSSIIKLYMEEQHTPRSQANPKKHGHGPWSMELEIESAVGEGGVIQKSPNEHAIIM